MKVYRVVLDIFLMSLEIAMVFSLLYFCVELFMHICANTVNYIYAHVQGVNMWFFLST